ncbi:hypothetical protein M9H77_00524 [Catharanthus roseus]|nr:hypothetical protein M9H77_00524 [Catharanthus roseus]
MGINGEEKFQKDYSLCDVYLFTHCKYSEEEISKVLEKDQRILFGEDVELEGPTLEFTDKRSEKIHRTWNGVGIRTSDFRQKWIIEIRTLSQDVADATCWDIVGKIEITSVQAMYKFVFLKVL